MNQVTHHDFGLFETDLLSVDFISFNIKRMTSHQITRLASYFQSLGFNSYQKQLDSNQSSQDINNSGGKPSAKKLPLVSLAKIIPLVVLSKKSSSSFWFTITAFSCG